LKRDPRGQIVSIVYFALVSQEHLKLKPDVARQTPTLVSVKKLPMLAFDHREIIDYALKRLRAKLEYSNVVYALLPKRFTLSELQHAYEIILGKPLDKRNFQKKYLSLGLIKRTKAQRAGDAHRPAALYEFLARGPQELRKSF
jgi:8-oxo-dGTP diphosphatase